MLRHPDYTRTRLKQLGERMHAKIYEETVPLADLRVSSRVERISHDEAMRLKFKPVKIGEQFGPAWATFWFKAKAKIPAAWKGKRADLLWISHSEATLWMNGRSMQGLNHEANPGTNRNAATRPDAILAKRAQGGETIEFAIEMACNRLFGQPSSVKAYDSVSLFVLDKAEVGAFDPLAWEMYYDFHVLQELEADHAHGLDPTWAGELLAELNRFANTYNIDDRATWASAHAILKPLYARKNATRVHELSAIGHAHIDTAWLWPLAETWRKCTRTFSTATAYMDDYPDYRFSCSQAYQYDIIRQQNPDLHKRIKAKIKSGQFIPVGGTWIEPDCNIPSGEALARQFLYGQRYFQKEFGITCREFWNPDVFGYNGQLPQIMNLAGIRRFLTQKLSWNRFNKPHHHTFMWQGLDGSEVLAHFPPADTYNAMANVKELRENAKNYKDHDRSRHSLMLFGYGDGGGGPTKRMLETLRRARDLQGLPRTKMRTSDEFFTLLEKDCTNRPRMIGELYFEYHRGTYTTQAATKRNNRKCEFLLHDVEFLAACASKLARAKYPQQELDHAWKILLLNQFHDILPGSSITQVYEDAARDYAEIRKTAEPLRAAALDALVGSLKASNAAPTWTPVNTTGFERNEVAAMPDGQLVFAEVPAYGIGRTLAPEVAEVLRSSMDIDVEDVPLHVDAVKRGDKIYLENGRLRAELSLDGRLLSLLEKGTDRETMSAPGNVFQIYDDRPTAYDAWDVDPFHLETERNCAPGRFVGIHDPSPLRVEVAFEHKIGTKSALRQVVRLDANSRRLEFHTQVDWQESNTMLKVAFPVNVRAMNATYEMQFGNAERPTHYNTMYDLARYEVPGHKWADLSEHGFGVALLTESKFGYSTFANTMRISLLRSPKVPDPKADMGLHRFSYAIVPHAGGWREAGIVAEGYRFNCPLLWAKSSAQPLSFFSVESENLVLDTVKKAEDSGDIVLRLYEAHGARGKAIIRTAIPFKRAVFCNILEEESGAAILDDGKIVVPYTPYQIVSVKLKG